MPMEQVRQDAALSKSEFHSRLRQWLAADEDAMIGPEHVDGRINWVFVRDGNDLFGLHADTRREAVDQYLQLVTLYGDDLDWGIVPSQRGKMTAVAYGPEKRRLKPFYLYAAGSAA